ncbi:MAG TPA: hypothetical protein VGI12_02485 [Vicinamibacterales bacterium]|jgi:hypothetical protein
MTDPHLAEWENFYVIVGSSAAALTGLQFVVIALVADRGLGDPTATSSFSTPTIVHFSAVLALSGVLSAPWHGMTVPLATLTALGIAGCAYVVSIRRAARRQREYRPVLEDRIFHWWLPFASYAALAASLAFRHDVDTLLFGLGFVAMLLLFIGIHNAWDSAVYVTQRGKPEGAAKQPTASEDSGD